MLVQVAEQFYERDELATAVARNFVVPLAITLPVLGVLIWVAVGRAMRSLTHVNQQVASRAADNLTSIDVADAPAEIGGLVTNLNQLFGRVQGLIEQERHFTADAAHELRTPLAGIRAQAQVARGATDDAERARALDGVMAGCDRATHAVEQMLTLARLAPDAVSFQPTSVELGAVLKATIGELAPFALAKHMDIALNDGRGAFVSGDAGLLAILFRNLIDNAIRYSAPGTKVDVDMEVTDVRRARDGQRCGPRHSSRAARERRSSVLSGAWAHRHRGAALGCRSCSGFSTCIEARSGSTRRRRTSDYRSRLLYRVLRDERA